MRIDIHNHFAPVEYLEVLSGRQVYPNTVPNDEGWVLNVDPIQSYQLQPGMHLIQDRIQDMDAAGIDTHVVSIICPAGETGNDAGLNVALAQAANEGLGPGGAGESPTVCRDGKSAPSGPSAGSGGGQPGCQRTGDAGLHGHFQRGREDAGR